MNLLIIKRKVSDPIEVKFFGAGLVNGGAFVDFTVDNTRYVFEMSKPEMTEFIAALYQWTQQTQPLSKKE